MRSSFFEFHVAISGAFTARSNLEIISHNTANAAIRGYSRQAPVQKAGEPLALNTGKGMAGTGSEVYDVIQARDVFLDAKYWSQGCVLGEYSGKKSQLAMIENIFNEMSGNAGIASGVADFFAKASDVSTAANDAAYRAGLIQSADYLAQIVNLDAGALLKQQTDANMETAITVERINSLGEQILSLNKRIVTHELDGSHANDLRDERARLVDDLSQLVNVEVKEVDRGTALIPNDKRYIIMLNGYDFVNHYSINPLAVVPRRPADRRNPMDRDGLYDIVFSTNNVVFDIYHPGLKGQLKGIIDARDGNGAASGALPTTAYKGIPYYLEKLNTFVRNLSLAVDQGKYSDGTSIPGVEGHANGYDLNGDRLGALIFTYDGGPGEGALPADFYNRMNCLDVRVNQTLLDDPRRINCASDPSQGESAYTVTKGFAMINNSPSLFREGKLTDFVTALNSGLGVDVKQARDFEASCGDILTAIDNQRIDVSGVDINEEMINMVKNQQMYQASAQLVSVINSIYDTMINRLGA
ncbi:MAG: flagellar hook-associated protein FlgK [Clostridiales bacterium]|jgi:flagellar hook-associated protein 1 FlgK|nr:flagellar hook-associated protein FlgK [Clostridiales bacterium]